MNRQSKVKMKIKIIVGWIGIALSFCMFSGSTLAVEPQPCCPPGTSAAMKAVILQLKAIKSSRNYILLKNSMLLILVAIFAVILIYFLIKTKKQKKNI